VAVPLVASVDDLAGGHLAAGAAAALDPEAESRERTRQAALITLTEMFRECGWKPNDAERDAAWERYVELATRIAVVPLRGGEGLIREALTSLYPRPASPQQVTAGPAQPGRDDNEGGDSHPASPQDPRATCLGGFPQPTMPPQREPRTCAAGRVRSAASGAPRHARYLAARRRPPWPAEGTGGEIAWTSDGHPSYHPCGMAPTDKRHHRHNKPTAGERGMVSCRPACREFGARRCRQRRCGLPRAAKVVPKAVAGPWA
jgi:hypothetical protein